MKTQYTYIDMLEKVMDIARDKAEADGYDFPYTIFNTQDRDYITSAFQTFKKQEEAREQREAEEAETLRLLKNPPKTKQQLLQEVVDSIGNKSFHGGRYPDAVGELEEVQWQCQQLLDGDAENDNELIWALQSGPFGCDTDSAVMLEHTNPDLEGLLYDLEKKLVEVEVPEEEVA